MKIISYVMVLFTLILSNAAVHATDVPPAISASPVLSSDASPYFVRLGVAGVLVDAGARISSLAGHVPGATVKVLPEVTATVEAGYRFDQSWSLAVSGGWPPTFSTQGAGTIRDEGKLGANRSGILSALGQYRFSGFGRLQPYVGIGPGYFIVFSNHDAFLSRYRLSSNWAVTGQIGVDYMITDRIGIFVDIKKSYLRTDATGFIDGNIRIRSDVKLDPLNVSSGVIYRF